MSELSACSNCLDLAAAKKLLVFIKKPTKQGSWKNWSGEGGSETEEKMENLPVSELAGWNIPSFCSSFMMTVSRELRSCSSLPSAFLIGGDSFALPEYGDYSCFDVCVVSRELNYPINLRLFRTSGKRHYGRKYNECCELRILFPENESTGLEGLKYGPFPSPDLAVKTVDKFRRKYGILSDTELGVIEKESVRNPAMGEISLCVEASRYDMLEQCLRHMVGDLLADSPDENYRFGAQVDIGGGAKFEGELHNVSPVIPV